MAFFLANAWSYKMIDVSISNLKTCRTIECCYLYDLKVIKIDDHDYVFILIISFIELLDLATFCGPNTFIDGYSSKLTCT